LWFRSISRAASAWIESASSSSPGVESAGKYMSAQVTTMIPNVKAFDKNVEGEAARDIEFTGAFSIE
jgi:hypothetical protein